MMNNVMATPETEKQLTANILKLLRRWREPNDERPVYLPIKLHGGSYQRSGMPDLLVVSRYGTMFIEVKTAKGKLTRLQSYRLAELEKYRATCLVVRSVNEVREVLAANEHRRRAHGYHLKF